RRSRTRDAGRTRSRPCAPGYRRQPRAASRAGAGAPAMSLRADALACHAAALAAVEPQGLVAGVLRRAGGWLILEPPDGPRAEHGGPVLVVGAGKAGLAMGRAAAAAAGSACRGGLVIVPH